MRFKGTKRGAVLGALVVTVALGAAGCSFSRSSEGSSKSSGASSKSSAASSKSGAASSKSSANSSGGEQGQSAEKQAYQDDVRDYTYAYVGSGDRQVARDAFARGLGDVARRHGLTDWEDDVATYEAIGAGLAKAAVAAGTLPTLERDLGGTDPDRSAAIRRGYDAYRKSS